MTMGGYERQRCSKCGALRNQWAFKCLDDAGGMACEYHGQDVR